VAKLWRRGTRCEAQKKPKRHEVALAKKGDSMRKNERWRRLKKIKRGAIRVGTGGAGVFVLAGV